MKLCYMCVIYFLINKHFPRIPTFMLLRTSKKGNKFQIQYLIIQKYWWLEGKEFQFYSKYLVSKEKH